MKMVFIFVSTIIVQGSHIWNRPATHMEIFKLSFVDTQRHFAAAETVRYYLSVAWQELACSLLVHWSYGYIQTMAEISWFRRQSSRPFWSHKVAYYYLTRLGKFSLTHGFSDVFASSFCPTDSLPELPCARITFPTCILPAGRTVSSYTNSLLSTKPWLSLIQPFIHSRIYYIFRIEEQNYDNFFLKQNTSSGN